MQISSSCIIVAVVLVVSTCVSGTSSILSFSEWCTEYGKRYDTRTERDQREVTYSTNIRLIHQLNDEYRDRGVSFFINQFADLSPDEFIHTILMPPVTASTQTISSSSKPSSYSSPSVLPDTFDWRDKHVVTDVKDQGSVGSCWAFSTVGNIEGQWALAGHTLTSLSSEQLVDCDATYDPNNRNMDCGVFGGWPYLAYQYIMRTGGIESESDYPYCSGTGKCFPCVPKGWNNTRCGPPPTYCNDSFSCVNKLDKTKFVSGLKLKTWKAIAQNETEMMSALVEQGPLSVLINAQLLQFYHSGVWDPIFKCDPDSLDHAVLLVGYGTEKGLLSDKPYWLIKNSWGKKWGEDGYFKMIRGRGKCGIDRQVTSAILE